MATKTTKIKSVIVGPFTYKIKYSNDIKKEKNVSISIDDEILGYCDNAHQVIYIDKKCAHDNLIDTLLHESLHALYYTSGLVEMENASEEMVIRILTPRIIEFFRDNKKLARMLFKV